MTTNGKIGTTVLNLNRTLGTILLAIITWLALQVWDGQTEIADDVNDIKVEQGKVSQRLDDHDRRLSGLESHRGAMQP